MSMDLQDVKQNRKRSKDKSNGGFNEFSSITALVKKYKESNSNDDMVEILKALEGIINTFTLMLCPGNTNQQIYITPYMKKLLGMFLSKEEQANSSNDTYNQALARIRWIMRHYSYEDIYSHILLLLINVVKKLRIVGECDCFYYIQWVMKFKVHKYIMDQTKDATVNIADLSNNPNGFEGDEVLEDVLDRLSFDPENLKYEEKLIDKYYESDTIAILARSDDIFKYLSRYEKYLLYLYDVVIEVAYKNGDTAEDIKLKKYNMILQLLKFETLEELQERFDDIVYKLELIEKEENNG